MTYPSAYEDFVEERSGGELRRAQEAKERAQDRYMQLRTAVKKLYEAAYWHADRPCDADALWSAVRDAALIADVEK